MRRSIAAGNWKMNGLRENFNEILLIDAASENVNCDVILCVPDTLIREISEKTKNIFSGGQNCHIEASGAFTGDISAEMIKDAGASHVIVGHSERRVNYNENNNLIKSKAQIALNEGLKAIICIGETLKERETGITLDIIKKQLLDSLPQEITGETIIIAYEPVWAIGTGLTPSIEQITEVHDFIRAELENNYGKKIGHSVNILYGGSMNAKNAHEISAIENVDGGLVGGASLKAESFIPIINALNLNQ
jgi:triosephosphate isomerase